MAIKIGHASKTETGGNGWDGKAKAGDQTGAEVCTRKWYNGKWELALRCRDASKAEKMAKACEEACANNHIGYDQSQRNTLNSQAKTVGYELSRIKKDCECDCSSLMTVCAQAAGISIPYTSGNAPRTATMRSAFTSTGMFDVLTDNIYLTTDKYLKRGDILVRPGAHTVMALETPAVTAYPTLKRGACNEYVRRMQSRLVAKGYNIAIDGMFGDETKTALIKFQTQAMPAHPKEWDGICGPKTWAALDN